MFWGLYLQIHTLRARDRLQSMMLANYMGVVVSAADNRKSLIDRAWRETAREAKGGGGGGPPDEYELLTRRGQIRAGLN